MNKIHPPEIGDKIDIETPEHMRGNYNKHLVSQIMDIIDEKNYFIAMPIVNNVLVPISPGEIIKIKYSKKDLGVYGFNAKVLSRKTVNNISYMKIERLKEISKKQRRNFFRLEMLLNVLISYKNSNTREIKTFTTFAKDISGGGIRLISKERLELQKKVTLNIETKKEPILLEGRVIRCLPYGENEFDIGIIFEDINETVRSSIISFIFEEQRKMRKKGLI